MRERPPARTIQRVNHPRMTSSGRVKALIIGVLIAFALPKRVECKFPGNDCTRYVGKHTMHRLRDRAAGCSSWLEHLFKRNIGFAYKSAQDCR